MVSKHAPRKPASKPTPTPHHVDPVERWEEHTASSSWSLILIALGLVLILSGLIVGFMIGG